MVRVNPNEADKYYEGGNGEWLKLANDGDVVRVQFLHNNFNGLDTFACHRVNVNGKECWVDCKRTYDDPLDMCPLCEAGIRVQPVMILSLYDHADGKIKLWERGRKFKQKLEALCNRYPNLSQMVFEIERHGAKGDTNTTYEIFPLPKVQPLDVSQIEKPELLGGVILDKSPDEMMAYVQTGKFPEAEVGSNQAQSQAVTRRNSQPTRGNYSQSTGSRRSGRETF